MITIIIIGKFRRKYWLNIFHVKDHLFFLARLSLIKLFKVTESSWKWIKSTRKEKKVVVQQWEQGKHITFILDKKSTSLE